MFISGEEIREAASNHEDTCPKVMKESFYYGFREGAKWAQSEIIKIMNEYENDKI